MTARFPAAFIFSVTYIGDLVQATLTFDAVADHAKAPPTVITSSALAPLLRPDPRLGRISSVRSSRALGWRAAVLRYLLGARRSGALVVNLEVYPPRWRFVGSVCKLLRVPTWTLDLPRLKEDSRRAADPTDEAVVPHISSHYARAVGLLGEEAPPPRLFADQRVVEDVSSRLSGLGERCRVVVVHPGSGQSWPAKRAPASLLAGILRRVASRCPIGVVLVGTETERRLCDTLKDALGGSMTVTNWEGRLSLPELPALLRIADLFIGNDSGPLKIAEAVGARTLSLWGPTSPRFLGPRGEAHRTLSFAADESEGAEKALELLGGDVA